LSQAAILWPTFIVRLTPFAARVRTDVCGILVDFNLSIAIRLYANTTALAAMSRMEGYSFDSSASA
jgi:hypothetical protein